MSSTLTLNPSAASVSPCDGFVRNSGKDLGMSALVTTASGAGAGFDSSTTNSTPIIKASITSNQFAEIIKFGFNFDTSPLGALVTVSQAVLSLYITAKTNGLGDDSYGIVGFTPTLKSTVASGDFNHFGASLVSNAIPYASISLNAYNDFTLTPAGIALILKTGVSSFGFFSKWAIDQSFSGVWASAANSSVTVNMADSAHAPKLVLTYDTTPAGLAGSLSLLGVGS